MRAVCFVMLLCGLARGPVAFADHHRNRFYGEMTVAAGGIKRLTGDVVEGSGFLLDRAALGWSTHPQGDIGLELRLGVALVLATGALSHSTPLGVGLETEINLPIATSLRFGARLGIDHHGFLERATSDGATVMHMLGARLRIQDTLAVGVDGFYAQYNSALWGRSTGAGLMGTVSLDNVTAGASNAGLLLLGFGLAFLMLAADT